LKKSVPISRKASLSPNLSLSDLTLDELAQKLSKFRNDSVVLLLQHFVDRNGTAYTVQESTPLLTKSSSVPVFVLGDIRMGMGVLGGHVVSGYHYGEAAAQMVVKIISGTDIRSLPVLLDSPNRYMFDYSVMQRFNIAESDLPQGSILINKPFSVLEKYKIELLSILAVFIVLCGILVYLLFEIRRRRRIETALRESEENYKDLVENANSIIIKMDQSGILIFVNDYAQKFFGYTWNEIIEKDVKILVPPDESSGRNLKEMVDNILRDPDDYIENINENIRKNGERVWISWRNKGIRDSNGNIVGNLAIGQDITERKRADEALRESEERHRTILQTAMDGISGTYISMSST